MWISEPIPVITRIMRDDSGSRYSSNGIWRSPDGSQVKTDWRNACAPAACCRSRNATSETTNAAMIARQATPPEIDLARRRPSVALNRNPANGRSGISSSMSPLQGRERIRAERLAVPEQGDDQGQADGRFGRRDGHDEEHDDLSV